MMDTTLNNMTANKKPVPSAEEVAAKELVRLAREQGLSLSGPDGLGKQFTKSVLETALNEEMTGHPGAREEPGATGSGVDQRAQRERARVGADRGQRHVRA